MKAHFHHFEAFLKDYPALLEVLSPTTYLYITRRDKIAQAVSMAKAFQTNWWTSRKKNWRSAQWKDGTASPLQYDRELIEKCLNEIALQDAGWLRWFEARGIAPHQVTYEDLTADADATVHGVIALLGVEDDEPDRVDVPPAEKQGDETNEEWIERFRAETKARGARKAGAAGRGRKRGVAEKPGAQSPPVAAHFFDRYDRLIKSLPSGGGSVTGFIDAIRLRRQYDAIVAANRDLFRGARVLDLMSAYGFWSLAALDAGAAHVVGIEVGAEAMAAAAQTFAGYGIDAASYRFVNSAIFAALRGCDPGAFDLVLCHGYFEHCHFPQFLFQQWSRLRAKHVILDTKIIRGHDGPTAGFSIAAGRNRTIVATPNHELIEFLCEPDFRWRLVDWQAIGITDWTGVQDYARDQHRTYVLERQ